MKRLEVVTGDGVYELRVGEASVDLLHDRVVIPIVIYHRSQLRDQFVLGISTMGWNSDVVKENSIDWLIARFCRERLESKNEDRDPLLTVGTLNSLAAAPEIPSDDYEREIARILLAYFRDKPRAGITDDVIADSTAIPTTEVAHTMDYFGSKGIIDRSNGTITAHGWEELERMIANDAGRVQTSGGYFTEVPLPKQYDDPYVFVLMPFDNAEFPQEKYSDLIKPTIEEATRINCWRADDRQNQELITNQIYTQIVRSHAIAAEITSLNLNVMIEIGISLAVGKSVYLFFDQSRLSKENVPFYLDKIPYHPYADDREFREKLGFIETDD